MRLAWIFALAATAAFALPPQRLTATELPKGAITLDGKPVFLVVKVTDKKVVSFAPATEKTANLIVRFAQHDEEATLIVFESKLSLDIKLDLYLSKDRERFVYTSSCPVAAKKSLFENWPYFVPFVVVSAIRVSPAGAHTCE
mgnify:CR=1 FL=1